MSNSFPTLFDKLGLSETRVQRKNTEIASAQSKQTIFNDERVQSIQNDENSVLFVIRDQKNEQQC